MAMEGRFGIVRQLAPRARRRLGAAIPATERTSITMGMESAVNRTAPALIAATLLLAATACGDGSTIPVGKPVSKTEFEQAGLRWPLTVDHGRIGCDGMAAWFKTDDGAKYGLNGMANEAQGYSEIEPIWAEDEKLMAEFKAAGAGEEVPVVRISIGDMIDEALKLCS